MKKHLIWDLPLRLFHWLLVLCLLGQWLTAEVLEDAMDWHFYIGYCTLGLVIFRLVWGFCGTRYAKFNHFIKGPKDLWHFVKSMHYRLAPTSVGHNPVGGLMLPAVLILVGLQAISGLFTTDDIVYSGPYYGSINQDLQQWMQWLHHNIFNLLLAFIALHLVAIFAHQFIAKHHIIGAMIHGKKLVEKAYAIPNSKLMSACVIACLIAVFIYWLIAINPPPVEAYYY